MLAVSNCNFTAVHVETVAQVALTNASPEPSYRAQTNLGNDAMQFLHHKVSVTEIHQSRSSSAQNLAFPAATVGDDQTLDCRQKLNQGPKRKDSGSAELLRSSLSQKQTLPCEEEPQSDQRHPRRSDRAIRLQHPPRSTGTPDFAGQHHRPTPSPFICGTSDALESQNSNRSWHEQSPGQFTDPQIQPQDNTLSLTAMRGLPERENPPHTTKRMGINSIIDPLLNPQTRASSRK